MNYELQYALTILTIVMIPLMLWSGKKHDVRKITYVLFALLIVADIAAYFLLDKFASYMYLAIITALSMFLIKKNDTSCS